MKLETKIKRFNENALQKSEIKPFTLKFSKRGKRIWKSENGLCIEAVKIGSYEYYEVKIIHGQRLGELNTNGQKLSAKEVKDKIAQFATKYNFNYIKSQMEMVRESDAGKSLYIDWCNLSREFIYNV